MERGKEMGREMNGAREMVNDGEGDKSCSVIY